jgi:Beta-galactosidase/Beta-galactosidase trimerisation domain
MACAAWGEEATSRMFNTEGHGRKADGYFPDDDPRRITALHDVETPHIVWAKPLAGGPVNVLALAPKTNGRWPVELAQRFEFDVRTVYGHDTQHLGAPPNKGLFVQGQTDVEARILHELNRPPDVIVSGIHPGAFGETVRSRILDLITDGVGYVGPVEGFELSAWQQNSAVQLALVRAAVPVSGLRLLRREFGTPETAADAVIRILDGPDGQRVADPSLYPRDGEAPEPNRLQYDWLPSMEQEAWCSLVGRAILWASGRLQPESALTADWSEKPLERAQLPQSLLAKGADATTLFTRIWDADGQLQHSGSGAEVPMLPAGRYFAGHQRVTDDGATLDWVFNTFEVTTPVRVAEVRPGKAWYDSGESVSANVTLTDDPADGSMLSIEILDNYGRCVFQKDEPATREITFEASARESLHLYNYVQASLFRPDGDLLSRERASFFLKRPAPETDDLATMVWEGCTAFDPTSRALLRRFAGLGIDAALNAPNVEAAQAAAMSNLHLVPYVTRVNAPRVTPEGVRQPCITAAGYLSTLKKQLSQQADLLKPYSPLAYSLGDDQHYVTASQDACWSPSCRARFAAWTQQRYETIGAVNQAWGTSYASFESVEPGRRAEALAAATRETSPDFGPLCHWTDHAAFLDEMLSDWHRDMADVVEESDSGAVAWYDCTVEGWLRPGSAWDFWQMSAKSRFSVQYLNPIVHDIFRCTQEPGTYHGTWYGGYGLYNYEPFQDAEFQPWWSVFRGINLHGLYYGGNSPNYFEERLICPDLGCTTHFEKVMENIHELQGGIARLLFTAEPSNDRIAVVYSPPSVHLTVLLGEDLPRAAEWEGQSCSSSQFIYMQCWEAMTTMLRDLGLSYDVIPASALEDGPACLEGYQLLVMSLNLRVNDAEADTVREFVRAGGTLLADAFAGCFSGGARPEDGGALADVLGLRFAPGLPWQSVSLRDATSVGGLALGNLAVDEAIVVDGAEAMAEAAGRAPVLLVNTFGAGHSIYLNVLARDYQIWRTRAVEMPFRDTVGALLAEHGGVTAAVACDVEVRGTTTPSHRILASETHRYTLDAAGYVAIMRHAKLRPDDSIYIADLRPKPVHITFDKKAHVYDVRNRMYRGLTDSIEDVLYPARAVLYALLPYEVRGIELESATAPGVITLSGRVVPHGRDATPVAHVLHIELADPSGEVHPELTRNAVAEEGRFSGRFFVGYNAAAGAWRVTVRDVATGVEQSEHVQVP